MIHPPLADCSILLVDDEEANLDLLESLLLSDGYRRVRRLSDPREVMSAVRAEPPDLLLLDLHMPHRTGYEVLAELREEVAEEEYLPVLVLTADVTREARDRALQAGARDFLTKPFDAVEVLLRVRNLLETRLLHRRQREARLMAEASEARTRLLAEASRVLAASLGSDTGLEQVVVRLVPAFANGCSVVLREGDGFRIAAACAAGLDQAGTEWLHVVDRLHGAENDGRPSVGARRSHAATLGGSGQVDRGEIRVLRGPVRPPFDDGDVDMLGDLAGRITLALENARLFAEAEQATQARERLLSVVAHDLRNPLAVVGMYAEMLLALHPPEEGGYAAEALGSIHRSTRRMQAQVEDLLDFSSLVQGGLRVTRSSCDPWELFGEAESLLRPLASARSVRLDIRGPPRDRAGPRVRVDPSRFHQVISNLGGNACKFTPDGGEVEVVWRVTGEGLEVSVRDSGPGIPREHLPHVFSAFWQAGEEDGRGVGLGLWIARAIVEAHGGRIWVESEPGSGALFHFTLPGIDLDGETDTAMGRTTHVSAPRIA